MTIGSVMITGANRGIGLEFVRQFVGLPDRPKFIFATCRNRSNATALNELAGSHENLFVFELNVTDYGRYENLFEEVANILDGDGLDLLINNAGILYEDSISTVTADLMRETFEVNTIAPLMCTQAALKVLRTAAQQNGKAVVVSITSFLGSINDNTYTFRCHYSYRVSKAALNMVSKSLSVDLAADNIYVVGISPGWVKTDMGGDNADLTAEESVSAMIDTILNKIDSTNSGKMIGHNGEDMAF